MRLSDFTMDTTSWDVGQRPSAAAEMDCEETVVFLEVSHVLLPMTIDPASEHGDEDVLDHRCAAGWKQRRNLLSGLSPT
jgi:hypothetical protein